ncbi:unnamed protein product, partial [Vitis vinifera]|uniref:Uncharacterized protein n=1 Tax=Vitis vinifera TaxID=29760 RepID=D7TW76_VITVI
MVKNALVSLVSKNQILFSFGCHCLQPINTDIKQRNKIDTDATCSHLIGSLDEWDITRKLVGYFSTPGLPHLMGM